MESIEYKPYIEYVEETRGWLFKRTVGYWKVGISHDGGKTVNYKGEKHVKKYMAEFRARERAAAATKWEYQQHIRRTEPLGWQRVPESDMFR